MQLTQEQIDIIESSGNIKINAVAGSGKTTTVVEYARTRPRNSKILYLAFNKSVRLEATKKFADKGLDNVWVETAHSLAYKYVMSRHPYKIRTQEYKVTELVELLGLKVAGEKHDVYVVANHINRFVAYFCNSDKEKVSDLDYLDIVNDEEARAFVLKHYEYIELQTRTLLGKMNKGEIEITHDFYLKKFQLANPVLDYDYILFDEGQDASPAMLDIFLKQPAIKVIVGDTHQQIYGWRFAVNSLEKAHFDAFQLSASFRFGSEIADLAMAVLERKKQLGTYSPIQIKGLGKHKEIKTRAILARTNLGLLIRAIDYMEHKKDIGSIYFEGNINSYMYADEGASLYDVLSLYNQNDKQIKDKIIRGMNDIEELEDYIEKTEDVQLGMMVELVKEYGNKIPGILRNIKEKHVNNDEKEKAEVVFSTIHRCKGLEYDAVELVDDFLTEEKLEKMKAVAEAEKRELNLARLNEEINLLYVAVTRAKIQLTIPDTLMPDGFPSSLRIRVIRGSVPRQEEEPKSKVKGLGKQQKEGEKPKKTNVTKTEQQKPKAIGYPKEKTLSPRVQALKESGAPWTEEMDAELRELFARNKNVVDLSRHFKRSIGAIQSRIKKLGLA